MFDLIRFFEKKEYVTDFLNGDFYMNSKKIHEDTETSWVI